MLKWFKKLTNRLFGEEAEEEVPQEEQQRLESLDEQREERPEFRFPIITDEEIYGWEDDELEEVPWSENKVKTTEQVDDFEPIPLYKNERWPEENRRIIRSNGHRLMNNDDSSLPVTGKETVREGERLHKHEQLQADLKVIQNQKRTQRFTPSTVPSPIYGYSKPPVNRDENTKVEKEPIQEEVTQAFEVEAREPKTTKEVGLESFGDGEEVAQQQPAAPVIDERFEAEEQEASPEKGEALASACEVVQPIEAEQVEEVVAVYEDDASTVQQFAVDEQEALDGAPEEVTAVDAQPEVQQEEPLDDQPTIEQVEKNDEKIVPFNVLMLKSDKRKLQVRESAKKIADEMKAKTQSPDTLAEGRGETSEVSPIVVDKKEAEHPQEIEPPAQESVREEVEQEIVEESAEAEQYAHYVQPAIDYLLPPESKIEDTDWLVSQSEKLEESLSHFNVEATVINAVQGPTVTRFELTVGQGTKVSRVRNLADDLKLTLAARDIRIEAPIPGRSSIGIEIPNRQARAVRISEVIQTEAFTRSESPMEAVLGLGLTGEPVTLDLRKMPHGLIAGATGSGKSVCINSILVSLLYKASPADLKMMLIDPKMVELAPFNGIPHLISPVITDVKAATAALKWAVAEMERRYELLAHAGARNIERYNEQMTDNRQFSLKMPYLLIVIDELADLMMMAPADVEVSISRIAQKARACGIHLIIATQRPSVDVITGIIKANIPTRIAFSVSSQVDSRTMIDMNGAERLLGKGDMLYIGNGESVPVRLQGTFVTDDEIERIIEHVQNEASPRYLFGQEDLLKSAKEEEKDPLFVAACQFIYAQNSASTSMLQRNFSIGYNRAAKLMDRMEELSFISPQQGSRARDVYLTEAELNKLTETIS